MASLLLSQESLLIFHATFLYLNQNGQPVIRPLLQETFIGWLSLHAYENLFTGREIGKTNFLQI